MFKGFHFHNPKTIFIRAIKSIAVILAGVLVISAVGYCGYDDVYSLTRITLHDFYEQDSIDTVFLGTSHVMTGVNTSELSEATGKNIYSLCSAVQQLDSSYMLLQEAYNNYHVREVWLEVSAAGLTSDTDADHTRATYAITDYVKWGIPKLKLLASRPDDNLILLFPAARLAGKDYSEYRIANIINLKSTESYKTYTPTNPFQNYVYYGHGSWAAADPGEPVSAGNIKQCSYGALAGMNILNTQLINQRQVNYLKKIISYCNKNDITLHLIMMPFTAFFIQYSGGYDEVSDYVKTIAEEAGVPYYDLNRALPEELNLPAGLYLDPCHINAEGEEIITEYFKGLLTDPSSKHFAATAKEARSEEFAGVVGVVLDTEDDGLHITAYSESDLSGTDMTVNGTETIHENNGEYFIDRDLTQQLTQQGTPLTLTFCRGDKSLGTFEVIS